MTTIRDMSRPPVCCVGYRAVTVVRRRGVRAEEWHDGRWDAGGGAAVRGAGRLRHVWGVRAGARVRPRAEVAAAALPVPGADHRGRVKRVPGRARALPPLHLLGLPVG